MVVRLQQVTEAFSLLFENLHSKDFCKSRRLNEWSEQQLHPLVRSFLLGYFGAVAPEMISRLPGALTSYGRIDYVVDNIAIEFAVRRPLASRSNVLPDVNITEIKKLIKWDGLAVLILFDFSRNPLSEDEVEAYRNRVSLGKGNHSMSAFNVAYYYRQGSESRLIKKNIRI